MQPMIQTDALSFSYPVEEGQRRTTALDNVTLSIERAALWWCWATTAPANPPWPSI